MTTTPFCGDICFHQDFFPPRERPATSLYCPLPVVECRYADGFQPAKPPEPKDGEQSEQREHCGRTTRTPNPKPLKTITFYPRHSFDRLHQRAGFFVGRRERCGGCEATDGGMLGRRREGLKRGDRASRDGGAWTSGTGPRETGSGRWPVWSY
jgi:hypothetical protein